jgi:hypothetical protein
VNMMLMEGNTEGVGVSKGEETQQGDPHPESDDDTKGGCTTESNESAPGEDEMAITDAD